MIVDEIGYEETSNHSKHTQNANLMKSSGIFSDAVKRLCHKFEFVLNYLVCEPRNNSDTLTFDTQLVDKNALVSTMICKSTAQRKLLTRFKEYIPTEWGIEKKCYSRFCCKP